MIPTESRTRSMRPIPALLRALQHPDNEMRRFAVSDLCEQQRWRPQLAEKILRPGALVITSEFSIRPTYRVA